MLTNCKLYILQWVKWAWKIADSFRFWITIYKLTKMYFLLYAYIIISDYKLIQRFVVRYVHVNMNINEVMLYVHDVAEHNKDEKAPTTMTTTTI